MKSLKNKLDARMNKRENQTEVFGGISALTEILLLLSYFFIVYNKYITHVFLNTCKASVLLLLLPV